MLQRYADRREAGRVLAEELLRARVREALVLALPRGGVPVGYEVAEALDAPLDLMLVRKLGVPGREELAMGAIASGGVSVVNEDVVRALGVPSEEIERVRAAEREELHRRERAYRGDRPPPAVRGRRVVIVDDGLATGASLRAGIAVLRVSGAAEVIAAVPVGPPDAGQGFAGSVDAFVCPLQPRNFFGVGQFYDDFEQTTDEEVRALLMDAWSRRPPQERAAA